MAKLDTTDIEELTFQLSIASVEAQKRIFRWIQEDSMRIMEYFGWSKSEFLTRIGYAAMDLSSVKIVKHVLISLGPPRQTDGALVAIFNLMRVNNNVKMKEQIFAFYRGDFSLYLSVIDKIWY
jgi:hypothetical protein